MKKKSGIAAIILSLSLAGPAQAGILEWIGTLATINIAQQVAPWANMWLNAVNIGMTYRNGQKIDAVRQDVQRVDDKINQIDGKINIVDGKVVKLDKKVDRTNTLVGAFHQEMKIGLTNVNDQLDAVNGVVVATAENLEEFKKQHVTDIKNLGEQIEARVDGLAIQISINEAARIKDAEQAALAQAEIAGNVKSMNNQLKDLAQATGEQNSRMVRMESMLQIIVDTQLQKDSKNKTVPSHLKTFADDTK